MFYLFLL